MLSKHSLVVNADIVAIMCGGMCVPYLRIQAHREGGVAGASAPGPGSPKGALRAPSKKNLACVKRGESEAEMGRLKTVHQTQHASSLELKFF